jgi:hypothetical protein
MRDSQSVEGNISSERHSQLLVLPTPVDTGIVDTGIDYTMLAVLASSAPPILVLILVSIT